MRRGRPLLRALREEETGLGAAARAGRPQATESGEAEGREGCECAKDGPMHVYMGTLNLVTAGLGSILDTVSKDTEDTAILYL